MVALLEQTRTSLCGLATNINDLFSHKSKILRH
jgi:hypothetical protein